MTTEVRLQEQEPVDVATDVVPADAFARTAAADAQAALGQHLRAPDVPAQTGKDRADHELAEGPSVDVAAAATDTEAPVEQGVCQFGAEGAQVAAEDAGGQPEEADEGAIARSGLGKRAPEARADTQEAVPEVEQPSLHETLPALTSQGGSDTAPGQTGDYGTDHRQTRETGEKKTPDALPAATGGSGRRGGGSDLGIRSDDESGGEERDTAFDASNPELTPSLWALATNRLTTRALFGNFVDFTDLSGHRLQVVQGHAVYGARVGGYDIEHGNIAVDLPPEVRLYISSDAMFDDHLRKFFEENDKEFNAVVARWSAQGTDVLSLVFLDYQGDRRHFSHTDFHVMGHPEVVSEAARDVAENPQRMVTLFREAFGDADRTDGQLLALGYIDLGDLTRPTVVPRTTEPDPRPPQRWRDKLRLPRRG